jgi:hypothetical protein
MSSKTSLSQSKLKVAWARFNTRLSEIRLQMGKLLKTIDEEKQEKEIEKLRQKINHS